MNNERLMYPEALRILAIFAVVVLHVAASKWTSVGVESFAWKVLNAYNSMVRWSVPVFVMVSGMFMLDPRKQLSLRTLFGKNALRIATAFCVWSAAYAANDVWLGKLPFAWNRAALAGIAGKFIFGHYHLWFLFLIVGLYAVTPVLRKIAEDRRIMEYFLVLAAVFAGGLSLLKLVPGAEDGVRWANRFSVQLPLGYAGYYVAGYYFKIREIGARGRRILYALGILGVVATAYFTQAVSVSRGGPYRELYGNLLPNTALPALAVFVFFKHAPGLRELTGAARARLRASASAVFGIYLVHDLFNQWLGRVGFHALAFNPLLAVPVVALVLFAASLAVVSVLACVPGVKKYAL